MVKQQRTWASRLGHIWSMVKHRKLLLVGMVLSGFTSSLADSFGVSLTVLLIFILIGRGNDFSSDSLLHHALDRVQAITGDSAVVLSLIIAGFILLKGALSGVYSIISSFIQDELSRNVELKVLDRFMYSDFAHLQAKGSGYMLSTIKNEPYYFARTLSAFSGIIISFISFSSYSLLLILISMKLTLLIGLVGVLLLVGFYLTSGPLRRYSRLVSEMRERLYTNLIGTVQALRSVRLFGVQSWTLNSYE